MPAARAIKCDDIMQSGRVFVRKLVSGKSERLIELLDANKH